jgi:hypothetical protein
MPQVRVLRHLVEELRRNGFAKAETGLVHHLLEGAGCDDDDVVAASAKSAAQTDERVNVAARPDGSHDEEGLSQVEK